MTPNPQSVCKHCRRPVTYSKYFGWLTKDDGISVCTKYNGKHEVDASEPASLNAPAETNPFSKGYMHRHGEPVSDACGEGKHSECTQDLTKCHCTFRGGHSVMHAYMNPPMTNVAPAGAEGQERKCTCNPLRPGTWHYVDCPAAPAPASPRLMISKEGEIHTYCAECVGDCSEYKTAPAEHQGVQPVADATSENIFKYGARTGGYPCFICGTTHDTNSRCPAEVTPKLEEIAAKLADGLTVWRDGKGFEECIGTRDLFMAILRPFITPASTSPEGKSKGKLRKEIKYLKDRIDVLEAELFVAKAPEHLRTAGIHKCTCVSYSAGDRFATDTSSCPIHSDVMTSATQTPQNEVDVLQSAVQTATPATPTESVREGQGEPDPWPMIWAIRGAAGSNSAYFNRQSAERFIAERKEPQRYRIFEYVPKLASPSVPLLDVEKGTK